MKIKSICAVVVALLLAPFMLLEIGISLLLSKMTGKP